MKKIILFFVFVLQISAQNKLLIPMDLRQSDHLKAYGITFNALEEGITSDWLLNYRGGSFMFDYNENLITNFEMEASALYYLGQNLGHSTITICAVLGNRITKKYN